MKVKCLSWTLHKDFLRERVKWKLIHHTCYTRRYLVSKFYLLAPEQIQCYHILWDPIAVCSHSKSEGRMENYFKTLHYQQISASQIFL